jgi:hypothetical protein
MNNAIEVKNLRKSYQDLSLKKLSLREGGEIQYPSEKRAVKLSHR